MKTKVTIVKCPCGHSGCSKYGLSDGSFYQGTGWEKERAQQYADAINSYSAFENIQMKHDERARSLNLPKCGCDYCKALRLVGETQK